MISPFQLFIIIIGYNQGAIISHKTSYQKAMKNQPNSTLYVYICQSSQVRSYFTIKWNIKGYNKQLIHIPITKVDKHQDFILKTRPTQKV